MGTPVGAGGIVYTDDGPAPAPLHICGPRRRSRPAGAPHARRGRPPRAA